MKIDFDKYGFKDKYEITKGSDASEFLENEFRNFFNYIPTSKRQKYADVWINPNFGYNLKTSCAKITTGRICTVQVAKYLSSSKNVLKIVHVDYDNNQGIITLKGVDEYFLEEIEYNISNQGQGFLQPKVNRDNSFKTRPKMSREDWLNEFKIKYEKYVEVQTQRLNEQKIKYLSLKVDHEPI
jgi:hypothetical protein